MSNRIYVRKNMNSISKISYQVAMYLKSGRSVQIQYSQKEREIAMRFHKKVTDSALYDDREDLSKIEFPVAGFVKYSSSTVEINTDKFDDPNGQRHLILVYDNIKNRLIDFKVHYSNIKKLLPNIINNIFPKREKW